MGRNEDSEDTERIGEYVRIYRRKKNGVWYANFQHHKRQYRESLKTINKKVAQRLARQIDGKLTAGRWKPAVEAVILRQLIHFALSRNMVAEDPMKGVKMPKPKPTKQPCWTPEQVQAILAASPRSLWAIFVLLAETGMRYGELAWLTWDDIDLIANTLSIRSKAGWKPKTGDQRTMPLSPAARAALASLPRKFSWVVTMPASAKYPVEGRQWSERRLLNALKRVLKPLGLVGKLHTFRHAFISRALVSGTPQAVLQEWVGHLDPKVTELYTHINHDASQTAMKRLSESSLTKATE